MARKPFTGFDGMEPLDRTLPIGRQIYHRLRNGIVSGELAPGIRVSEAVVADSMQVSRQPVRETFIKLAEEGLLEIMPQRGTFVPKISVKQVTTAQFVREAIEADITKLAAERFTAAQIAELRVQLSDQEACIGGRVERFITLDDQFHRSLAAWIDMGQAWDVIETLKAQFDRVRFLSIQKYPVGALVQQHRRVVDAIEAGDSALAAQAMREHLRTVLTDLPKIAAERPELFD
ncbi:MAG: GntR family transcriptional regulator [Rhodobacteraceae bacterium]|nr:GntR family transcriptional regulator [Paracoccaceae bacterium]